jgi:three-Cys-motif partner protein
MTQRVFGSGDTVVKLKTVADYLNFYTKALAKQPFRLKYLDAFAGTGSIPFASGLPLLSDIDSVGFDIEQFIEGSARRALQIERPFDQYVFAELESKKVRQLEGLKSEFQGLTNRMDIWKADANDAVAKFCDGLQRLDRAVIFLDPFGNQVGWETLERIASTEKADLWYLFPAGLGVARQISNDGNVQKDAERSLDRLFGTSDWRQESLESSGQSDLFGNVPEANRKIATADKITRFMISRLKSIFKGYVSERWMPMGSGGVHKFSLLFACANPSGPARALASRVANEIMTRK